MSPPPPPPPPPATAAATILKHFRLIFKFDVVCKFNLRLLSNVSHAFKMCVEEDRNKRRSQQQFIASIIWDTPLSCSMTRKMQISKSAWSTFRTYTKCNQVVYIVLKYFPFENCTNSIKIIIIIIIALDDVNIIQINRENSIELHAYYY